MSLTVSGSTATTFEPIEQGTHIAVCNMLIDLGMQYSEAYKNSSHKVLIGWEIPDSTYEADGKELPRTITKRYTASLNERATLRQDLAAWRSRDFTDEELAAFDLRNILGANCMINVTHREGSNGKVYADVKSVMALPKGTPKTALVGPQIIFDLEADPLEAIEDLPEWIRDTIKKSETYQNRLSTGKPEFEELPEDDGELPF